MAKKLYCLPSTREKLASTTQFQTPSQFLSGIDGFSVCLPEMLLLLAFFQSEAGSKQLKAEPVSIEITAQIDARTS